MENYPSNFNPITALVYAFKHYADFKGRARRMEFWMFMLAMWIIEFVVAIFFVISVFDSIKTIDTDDEEALMQAIFGLDGFIFLVILGLAVMLPYFACWARRLHDIGMSGFWLLTLLIPYVRSVAELVLFIMCCFDSKDGVNKYGPNPKGIGNYAYTNYSQSYGVPPYGSQPQYGPPPQQPGYGNPPQTGYGTPPQSGYGNPQPQQSYTPQPQSYTPPTQNTPPPQPAEPPKPKSQSWEDDPNLYL
jgi:uncharacterized membrane protein YhaH (DUF805 family)